MTVNKDVLNMIGKKNCDEIRQLLFNACRCSKDEIDSSTISTNMYLKGARPVHKPQRCLEFFHAVLDILLYICSNRYRRR